MQQMVSYIQIHITVIVTKFCYSFKKTLIFPGPFLENNTMNNWRFLKLISFSNPVNSHQYVY